MTACNSAHAFILAVHCSCHTAWKYFSFSQCRLWKCFVPCQKVQKWALDLMGKALHCLPQWVVRYWTPPIQATLWSCTVCHKTSVRNTAMLVVMSYWALKLSYLVYAQTGRKMLFVSVVIGWFKSANCSLDSHIYTNLIAMCAWSKRSTWSQQRNLHSFYPLYPSCRLAILYEHFQSNTCYPNSLTDIHCICVGRDLLCWGNAIKILKIHLLKFCQLIFSCVHTPSKFWCIAS